MDNERFYVLALLDLTIYGHTVDDELKADPDPHDWKLVQRQRERGIEFGRWFSKNCRDGELGTNVTGKLLEVDRELFEKAQGMGWPTLPPLVNEPNMGIATLDKDGQVRIVWDSVRGKVNYG
jgi:hypothetical protein